MTAEDLHMAPVDSCQLTLLWSIPCGGWKWSKKKVEVGLGLSPEACYLENSVQNKLS
jgi:hypothetical protein